MYPEWAFSDLYREEKWAKNLCTLKEFYTCKEAEERDQAKMETGERSSRQVTGSQVLNTSLASHPSHSTPSPPRTCNRHGRRAGSSPTNAISSITHTALWFSEQKRKIKSKKPSTEDHAQPGIICFFDDARSLSSRTSVAKKICCGCALNFRPLIKCPQLSVLRRSWSLCTIWRVTQHTFYLSISAGS